MFRPIDLEVHMAHLYQARGADQVSLHCSSVQGAWSQGYTAHVICTRRTRGTLWDALKRRTTMLLGQRRERELVMLMAELTWLRHSNWAKQMELTWPERSSWAAGGAHVTWMFKLSCTCWIVNVCKSPRGMVFHTSPCSFLLLCTSEVIMIFEM